MISKGSLDAIMKKNSKEAFPMKDKMILALLLGIISFSGNAFAAVKPTEAIPARSLMSRLREIRSLPFLTWSMSRSLSGDILAER